MKRVLASLFFIILIIAVSGLIIIFLFNSKREIPARIPEPPRRAVVEVQVIKTKRHIQYVHAYGTILPVRKGLISAQVSGTIKSIEKGIDVGARVRDGQELARIKDTLFRIQYEKAKALLAKFQARLEIEINENKKRAALFNIARQRLELAEAEYARKEALWKKKLISEQEFDLASNQLEIFKSEFERAKTELESRDARVRSIEADIASAKAEIAKAEEDLYNTIIRAPFDGIITERDFELGNHVKPGKKLFTIVDISSVKVRAKIPSEYIARIIHGGSAEVSTEAFAGRTFQGRIENINVEGDLRNRSFSVQIRVPNKGKPFLLPGMFAKVRISIKEIPDAIMIPRETLLTDGSGSFVFIADKELGKAQMRRISLGMKTDKKVLVLEGLEKGELLITSGQEQLHDGAMIIISVEKDAAN